MPSHKVIPGTGFTVDGFRYPVPWVKAYFLSHAHSGRSRAIGYPLSSPHTPSVSVYVCMQGRWHHASG